jgi:hypothetical protein
MKLSDEKVVIIVAGDPVKGIPFRMDVELSMYGSRF